MLKKKKRTHSQDPASTSSPKRENSRRCLQNVASVCAKKNTPLYKKRGLSCTFLLFSWNQSTPPAKQMTAHRDDPTKFHGGGAFWRWPRGTPRRRHTANTTASVFASQSGSAVATFHRVTRALPHATEMQEQPKNAHTYHTSGTPLPRD